MGWNTMMGSQGWCLTGMGAGWLFTVALLGALLFAGYALMRRAAGTDRNTAALDTLRQRYARGELSAEDFASMRRTLGA